MTIRVEDPSANPAAFAAMQVALGIPYAILTRSATEADDISTALQAEINAAYSVGYREVIFPSGLYCCKNIRLKSGTRYRLAKNAVIKTHASATIGTNLLNVNSESDIVITGGVVDGNKGVVPGSPSSGVTLLQMAGSTDITVRGVTFQNNEYLAVVPSQASKIRVENCEFYNTDCAFHPAQECSDVWATGNYIDGGSSDGIVIWATSTSAQSTNVHISRNTIKNKAGGFGIIVRRCTGFEITENLVDTSNLGINLNSGEANGGLCLNGTIAGNVVRNVASTYAIGGSAGQFVDVTDNVVTTCNNDGIRFDGLAYSQVKGNIVTDVNDALSDSSGIRMQSATRCNISDNIIVDNRGTTKNYIGVRMISGDRNTVGSNHVRNTTLVDIRIEAAVNDTDAIDNDARVDDVGVRTRLIGNLRGADSNVTVSSTTITLRDAVGDVFTINAASAQTIKTINGGWDGRRVTLVFSRNDTTIDSTGNLRLAGSTMTSGVNATLTLVYKGSTWKEASRSANDTTP